MRVVAVVAISGLFAAFGASAASAQTATQDINISATVTKACTINNIATGVAASATIPVSLAGAVDTTPITPAAFTNVACNAAANVQLTSVSGGVVNATVPPGGFTNVIDYTASATWSTATANLNTSSNPAASGNESGALQPVASAASGNLTVTITPLTPALPLVIGAYADILRVSLIPQ